MGWYKEILLAMSVNARNSSGYKGSREEDHEKLQDTLLGLLRDQLIDVHTMAEVLASARGSSGDHGRNRLHREN